MANEREPDKSRHAPHNITSRWNNIVSYLLGKDIQENDRKTEECWKIIESGLEDLLSSRRTPKR